MNTQGTPGRRRSAHTPRPAPGRRGKNKDAEVELRDLPLSPKRWRHVVNLILREHNWRHSSKHKGVSHKTMAERRRFCHWLFQFLREPPLLYKLDPRSFSGRHADALTAYWQAEARAGRMSPATIQTYFSFLKTFTTWIGKPKLLRPIGCYFDDPRLHERSLASGVDKSWRAKGVDVDTVIRQVAEGDVHAAASLKLMRAFHLRFKESVMLRPHEDVVTAAQARRDGEGAAFYLDTHRATKGGRERMVAINTPERQEAIEYARAVTMGLHESVSDPRMTLQQALRHLRYVMERHGVTRAGLGVTPHGLRHQGAADDYKEITGELPPVAGGAHVDPALDRQARQRIAEHLGHGRVQITNAYFGRTPTAPVPPNRGDSSPNLL